ncbi:sigma factor [Brevibacillus borstelensis]|uniref:sigma factor n=1 Tax=Brevibacillus borstelensis TaxID=45462 RepID=UPI003CC91C99
MALEYAMSVYGKNVYALVHRIIGGIGSREDIEECVSDVFIAAWKKIAEFDEGRGTALPVEGFVANGDRIVPGPSACPFHNAKKGAHRHQLTGETPFYFDSYSTVQPTSFPDGHDALPLLPGLQAVCR